MSRAYAPPPPFNVKRGPASGSRMNRFYILPRLFIRALRERREGRVIKSSRGERAVFAVMRGILFSWKWSSSGG